MRNKTFKALSIILGLFFLFSFVSKVLTFEDWMSFNYELVDNKFGYVNGATVLLIELFYIIAFITLRAGRLIILSCFGFILFLTIFVLLNKDLFQSCMCFGKLISIKPDMHFILKNALILIAIAILYMLRKKPLN
jgi:hypothetical protein